MKKHFKYTPVALAVAALVASPLVFANDSKGDDHVFTAKADLALNVDTDITHSSNSVSIDIDKQFNFDEDVYIDVDVDRGDLGTGAAAYARALIDDTQSNKLNVGENGTGYYDQYGEYHHATGHDNDATASGSTLRDAAGNIGVNIAAGDNLQQDNSAALAIADAEMTFGIADAQAHSSQDGELNKTYNVGVTNNASATDNALRAATGNVGVNIAAGNNNQQKNNLSIATSTGGVGLAMVTTDQESDRNYTHNTGSVVTLTSHTEYSGTQTLSGTYSGGSTSGAYGGTTATGTADQIGNLYADIWANDTGDSPVHPTDNPGPVAHVDLDSAAQGAQDLNGDGGALAFNTTSTTNGGSLGFTEAGNIVLSGTFSGSSHTYFDVYLPSTNSASLSGNSLRGAAGNIGVNVASGTGNQQVNSLAIASSTGMAMGGGMPGGGGTEP